MNMNPFAFELINSMHPLEGHLISLIDCQPFNAEEIKEMVMRRHRSSGLKFRIEKKKEEGISEIALARLFNRYFDHSNGIPGTALFQWLSNIEKVSAGTIQIRLPRNIDLQPMENLDDDSTIVLLQLLLHKRMSYSKLSRVLGVEPDFTEGLVNSLLKNRVIEERAERVFQINPFLEPSVRKVLKHRGLI